LRSHDNLKKQILLKDTAFIFDELIGGVYSKIKNVPPIRSEIANVNDTEAIINLHKKFIEAGVHAIRTNSLMVNQANLKNGFNAVSGFASISYKNAEDAVKAANMPVYIFACIGEIPDTTLGAPLGEYKNIIDVFDDCGAYAYFLEGFKSAQMTSDVSDYIRSKSKKNVVLARFDGKPDKYYIASRKRSLKNVFQIDLSFIKNSELIENELENSTSDIHSEAKYIFTPIQ